MKFISTRKSQPQYTLSEALQFGLAPDGGLFVPTYFPKVDWKKFGPIKRSGDYAELAEVLLYDFFAGDLLSAHLQEICRAAFHFAIPTHKLDHGVEVLELFHGPTCAFKDVGARFLAEAITYVRGAGAPKSSPAQDSAKSASRPRMVLVATSGDTGGAVGAAFSNKSDVRVVILYPQGRISQRQEQQLTCWGPNVQAYAVRGAFDDCQKLVKAAFLSEVWRQRWQLISANSISLGRLLPQMVYYAGASLEHYYRTGEAAHFIVPTGNLGNAVAGFWAREMGFPIAKIGLALNANAAIAQYFQSGEWKPLPTQETLANAMDVGAASNMERLRHLFPRVEDLREVSRVNVATDNEIRAAIQSVDAQYKYIICPHTATGFVAAKKWGWPSATILATAHPAKFDDVVAPLIGRTVPVPAELESILHHEVERHELAPDLNALYEAVCS